HVLEFYGALLAELGVVRSTGLARCRPGETILVAGVKVATQTPAVRSGQRIIFATLDDAVGLVDLAFFESVQERCAARLVGSCGPSGPADGLRHRLRAVPVGRDRRTGRRAQARSAKLLACQSRQFRSNRPRR